MATSKKDYLKRYQSVEEKVKKPKKAKKRKVAATKALGGVVIVDSDAGWQKNIDEDDEDDADIEEGADGPQVIEDVEVKRMHQMERLKQHRPYMSIGDDGSGWVNVTERLESPDISPPRRMRQRMDSPDESVPRTDMPPPQDISPPRRMRQRMDSPDESVPRTDMPHQDISPPRRMRQRMDSPDESVPRRDMPPQDISPPRRRRQRMDSPGESVLRRDMAPHEADTNPIGTRKKTKMTDGRQAGLTSDVDLAAELARRKQDEAKRMKEMEPSVSGRGAETIYRDKRGKRLEGLEELLRQQQGEVKPEVKPLEWGKGLAQKREVEQQKAEYDAEKSKPFARSRDDPELDKLMKGRLRWGDPMAHLVKTKDPEAMLVDLGATDEMKESGFIIPQDVPKHSWLKRGIGAPMNRYGIKPGRHWDGVDRSTGFEAQMFKAKAEKQANELEAYMWSVADM